MEQSNKKWIFRCSFLLTIVVCFICFLIASVNAGILSYEKNDDGLTYGSLSMASTFEEEPDLIAAIATNDREGYVYKTDLKEASREAKNPEEAVWMMKKYEENSAKAFAKVFSDNTGINISAETVIESGLVEPGNIISTKEIKARSVISKLGITNELDDRFDEIVPLALEKAIAAAGRANIVVIPVYAKDGKTIIGEFEIGGGEIEVF